MVVSGVGGGGCVDLSGSSEWPPRAIPVAISIAESWGGRDRAMENSREGWNNRGSDGSRGGRR